LHVIAVNLGAAGRRFSKELEWKSIERTRSVEGVIACAFPPRLHGYWA
jgi:hypothetical protein